MKASNINKTEIIDFSEFRTATTSTDKPKANVWGGECIKSSENVEISGNTAPLLDGTDKRDLKSKNNKFVDNKYGHLPYKDCKSTELTNFKGMQVHKKTAAAFAQMQEAAKKDGININIVSGFRSTERQVRTFAKKFPNSDIKYATKDQILNRAKWSAPPGYSEHHTGFAIDINCTETSFENTKEYKWLKTHASEYGFETSFNNE